MFVCGTVKVSVFYWCNPSEILFSLSLAAQGELEEIFSIWLQENTPSAWVFCTQYVKLVLLFVCLIDLLDGRLEYAVNIKVCLVLGKYSK